MESLISIIVPIYKVEKYLNRCIKSILNQTYKNIEIILVDDGSPDNCGKICDRYANEDKRIKVIHKKNGGLSDARNAGLEICTGEYISFIDSDDWVEKNYIEVLYNLIKLKNSDIAICNYIEIFDEKIKSLTEIEEIYTYSNIDSLYQLMGKNGVNFTVAWGKLYKKTLFENIRFPVGKIHEDEYTTYKLLYISKKVSYTTKKLYYYLKRKDSITGESFNIKNRLDAIEAIKERIKFFNDNGLIELSYLSYKTLFFLYLDVIYYLKIQKNNVNLNYKKNIYIDFNNIKSKLKKTKFDIKFKIFYEMSFLAPFITYSIFIIIKKIKKLLKN